MIILPLILLICLTYAEFRNSNLIFKKIKKSRFFKKTRTNYEQIDEESFQK
jgi:hypothetical protein